MANEWWLILGTPAGPRCWPVGSDEGERVNLVAAARVLAGFPADEAWVDDGTAWDVQLTPGEPHLKLLANATVGTLADLRAVPAGQVNAHNRARADWARPRRARAVAQVIADLDPDTLAAVLADPAVTAKVRPAP